MSNITKAQTFSLVCTVLLLAGCNGLKLDRQEAKELIIKTMNLPQNHTSTVGMDMNLNGLRALQEASLITYTDEQKFDMSTYQHYDVLNIIPTAVIKPYYLGKNANSFIFKTYDTDFDQITGIAINKEQQTATVRFTTKAINVNLVATVLSRTPYAFSGKNYITEILDRPVSHELTFKKFDSGWQLQ